MTRAIRVGVVGLGYVGLTTAVCLAERGHDTVAIDIDESKIELLNRGHAVIDEPELAELIRAGLSGRLLRFDCDYRNLADREVVFVCVPTPSGSDGAANLGAVTDAVDRLRPVLRSDAVLAMKSTVPVGTTQHMKQRLDGSGIRVAAVPEFLREGRAVQDCRHPDRVVVGASGDGEAAV
uniref:NAD(P)-binding domain-containing protein n=1 Tax=Mycobacteroides abscessus TaxID=36809 RepID=UPI001890A572